MTAMSDTTQHGEHGDDKAPPNTGMGPDVVETATVSESVPLEALFSPQSTSFIPSQIPGRESLATLDLDDDVDEFTRFSTVPLTSRQNEPDPQLPQTTGRPHSFSTTPIYGQAMNSSGHKKSASTTTIRSQHNLPFLMSHLDLHKNDEDTNGNRNSIDGQQKLQEEFARIHKDREEEEKASNGVNSPIDWDFWGAVISDYQQFATNEPDRLAAAIAKGIPGTLRGMMWQLMSASKDPELEDQYLKLLKEKSTHEKAITRDLGRTFPHHAFFTDGQGIGQENLFNVLKAYSLYDPEVGYCQGLPFVVAILLLNMPDEEAFSLLVRLMYVYDLRGHFLPEMPRLQLRLYQFDRLIEELLPVLHVHFLRQGIKSSMFCSQWFLTMFSYRFPLHIVFRIYDNCLASGIEAIFGFSIALLQKNEEILLSLKFDEILGFLNTRLFEKYQIEGTTEEANPEIKYRVDEFVNDAVSMRITPFMLDTYAHEYAELMRETNKRAVEMDELRNSNRALSSQLKSLENSLAQINQEHVDLLNELVKARLKNEETEAELVRYKLLYAEAMHANEDAQSAQRISFSQMLGFKRGSSVSG